ncbi:hypothetical protein RJ640_002599 [Escallonia rubra]|uniref:Pectinesterase catalytic domain-containing protein n=1 Tax=Escallonia rubra TaxID=112253 RepID=A0AA88R3N0_9ASTE|nr:hypothetical protein RJ640_002599 [Escallonia rubra]
MPPNPHRHRPMHGPIRPSLTVIAVAAEFLQFLLTCASPKLSTTHHDPQMVATPDKPPWKFLPPCETQEKSLSLIEAYSEKWCELCCGYLRTIDWDVVAASALLYGFSTIISTSGRMKILLVKRFFIACLRITGNNGLSDDTSTMTVEVEESGIVPEKFRVASALRSSFNATVAQDTSGDYTRTTHAIVAAPVLPQRRDHTETKPGIYDEQVDVWINKTYIAPIGDDASTTKITRSRPRARGLSEIDDPERQDCGRGCAEFGEGYITEFSTAVSRVKFLSVKRFFIACFRITGNNGFSDDTSTMTVEVEVEESGIVPEKFRVASALRSSFNATVAQDTSGDYTRTTHAIAAAPVLPQRRDHTETKPGIYDEQVDVWINKTYIAPIGDDASTTKITRSRPRARGLSEIDDPERQDCGRGCAEFGEVLCVTVRVASALRSSFNATVAQDTSGGYTRTTQAIAAAPVLPQRRDHTETKPVIYDEQVDVWINKTYIAPIGDDASTTKITRSRPRARGFSEIDDPGRQDCGRGCAEFGEAIQASKIHIFRNKFPKVWIFQCLAASTKWVIAPFRSGCSNLQCPLTSLSKSVWAVSMASIRERLYINPRVYLPVVSIRIGR